jgi:hypothetical protein
LDRIYDVDDKGPEGVLIKPRVINPKVVNEPFDKVNGGFIPCEGFADHPCEFDIMFLGHDVISFEMRGFNAPDRPGTCVSNLLEAPGRTGCLEN